MAENGENYGAPGAESVGHVIVAARDEDDRIAATVHALNAAFPNAVVVVADDGSVDRTAAVAMAAGAVVVRTGSPQGKGQAASLGAAQVLKEGSPAGARRVVLLADADLADSASRLTPLAHAVTSDEADVTVAVFASKVGGGFGWALAYAHTAILKRCGLNTRAPISGQRALTYEALEAVTPFAPGFGMEIGMTIAAVRAGLRFKEIELDLSHRATGKSLRGFIHRGRQLRDFHEVYRATKVPS